jgi:hypothetical protein
MDSEFVEMLRKLMRAWHWSEAQIDEGLPKVIEACRQVGIVAWQNGKLVGTDLIEDDEAWDRVWAELAKEGIGDNYAS